LDLAAAIRSAAARLHLLSREGDLSPSMDSIDMVNLFVELEAVIGRPIPPESFSPESFASVSALTAVLESVIGQAETIT
jgi:hypothetical protein